MTVTENHPALLISLQACVPLRILELRHLADDQRVALARRSAQTIACHGDDLMFGGRHCAKTWAALVTGLAAAAYQPGGVTFAGLHWCVDHAACVAAEPAGPIKAVDLTPTPPRPRRPIVDLELPA